MSVDQVTRYALKPLSVAGISAGAAAFYYPGVKVRIGETAYPLPVLVGGAAFAASMFSEYMTEMTLSHLPAGFNVLSHPAETALNIGIQTGTAAAIENYMVPGVVGKIGVPQLAIATGLAEMGGSYLAQNWLAPWYAQMSGRE